MRTARLSIAIFAAQIALALPALASAQVQAASYAVFGTIAAQDGRGIADAEVGVLDHDRVGRRVRSDTAGHFELDGLTNASTRLRVRHMGFAPRDVAVEIGGSGRRTGVVVTLDPMAAELDGMTVNDTLQDPDDRLRAFNERRATNDFAHFIDGDA